MAEVDELLRQWTELAPAEPAQWESLRPGPPVLAVATRLAGVPSAFLAPEVSLRALAGDVLGYQQAATLACTAVDDPRVRRGGAVGLWMVAGETLLGPLDPPVSHPGSTLAVDALALRLAPLVDPADWIADPDRREEAARTFLLWNGQLPAGEDVDSARSALAARDSLQFNRALAAGFAEQQHRAELRRRLEDARAREAAARYSRE